ncbi:MAG: prolipoprotein diacylglyceryl transferase [Spirochaetaceae bacterium]|nr:prolipoprotein diacylglyceryl transferase [Spirochaetaceae bacterium]
MLAALQFPAWISPEVIPGLPFRWYGVMYVVAFAATWFLFRYESKRRSSPWTEDDATGFFFWAILGLLLGARLFGTLLYDPTGYYWRKPWFIFWPFDEGGRFVGFQGMSYHGGFFGLIVATLLYARSRKLRWLDWADVIAVSAPLGYTAGRLGNFINGELWGKVTASPLGIVFPGAERFSAREPWVQELALRANVPLASMNDLVNLPRHPSQLYEALFEGLVLWALLWLLVRKRKAFPGFAVGLYAIGYGAVRFVIEYFREPDAEMGYILKFGDPAAPPYLVGSPWNFSMGQLLCAAMILGGVIFLLAAKAADRRRLATEAAAAEAAAAKAGIRKFKGKKKRR